MWDWRTGVSDANSQAWFRERYGVSELPKCRWVIDLNSRTCVTSASDGRRWNNSREVQCARSSRSQFCTNPIAQSKWSEIAGRRIRLPSYSWEIVRIAEPAWLAGQMVVAEVTRGTRPSLRWVPQASSVLIQSRGQIQRFAGLAYPMALLE